MRTQNGIDVVSRERVYTDNFNEQKEFGREAFKTPIGQRFLSDFENTPENIQVVLDAAATLYPGELVTVSRFVAAMETAMNRAPSADRWTPGKLKRNPVAPVVAPTPQPETPRDKNGKVLTAAQQAWSEYRQFSESNPMSKVRERMRTDVGYRSFVEKQYQREGLVEGEGKVLNGILEAPTDSTSPELIAWVAGYLQTPAEKVKKLRRADFNPLGYKAYNRMLELAASKNLI